MQCTMTNNGFRHANNNIEKRTIKSNRNLTRIAAVQSSEIGFVVKNQSTLTGCSKFCETNVKYIVHLNSEPGNNNFT